MEVRTMGTPIRARLILAFGFAVALMSLASGCGEGSSSDQRVPTAETVQLSAVQRLARISVALCGVRPSVQGIEAVEADASALGRLVDEYLVSEEFGATIRTLHNDSLLVLTDYFVYPAGFPPIGALDGEDTYDVNRSIMEAPLRLIEHVVMDDRPYTEIVTAEYTLANAHVAAVWGVPYSGDGDWELTAWDDMLENAGILSDSWLFQRKSSLQPVC